VHSFATSVWCCEQEPFFSPFEALLVCRIKQISLQSVYDLLLVRCKNCAYPADADQGGQLAMQPHVQPAVSRRRRISFPSLTPVRVPSVREGGRSSGMKGRAGPSSGWGLILTCKSSPGRPHCACSSEPPDVAASPTPAQKHVKTLFKIPRGAQNVSYLRTCRPEI